jgi:small conductance mechanosensitive channel
VDHAAPDLHRHGQGRGRARGQGASGRGGIGLPEPTYRLIGDRAARSVPPETGPSPPLTPRHPPARVEAQEIGADEKAALETLIEVEREALPDDDLLRREAPQE